MILDQITFERSVTWFSIRSRFVTFLKWFYWSVFVNAQHYLSYSDNIFLNHCCDNVTRSFKLWILSKFKFRSNFVGTHLLLTSSKTIISTIIGQLTVIEDERRVVRRCRDFTIIILFPREYQYLSTVRPMYISIFSWFFSISLWFYLHCRSLLKHIRQRVFW